MNSKELRERFLSFFEKKGHKIVPSSSLIPADPSVLFTTAGMQQFIPYLSGEKDIVKDFGIRHLTSIQKCFRTLDIDEVGDDTHHTFFEMLGNWSIGEDLEIGYFKEGAIKLALDFFADSIGLEKDKFWITIFKGEKGVPRDEESLEIWQKYGIPRERFFEFGLNDNFWGPVGEIGPCGPCSEIHYDRGPEYGCGSLSCGPNCEKCNRFVELWNLVFMEYNKNDDGSYSKLSQRNVDTGIGFERLAAVLQNKNSAYETGLFLPIIKKLEEISGKKYEENKNNFRIIADHIRGSIFLIAEGILPSNVERGYILRRILRRAIRYGKLLSLPETFLISLARKAIEIYQNTYPELKSRGADILTVIQNEEEKFEKTLSQGLRVFNRILSKVKGQSSSLISGIDAFHLFDTYGFPLELTMELARENNLQVDKNGFEGAFEEHRKISRAGVEKKFGGIGKEADYKAVKLHTATHLLHSALRKVLGGHVRQMGSDITFQRLRFDFSHPRKMTEEEVRKVENLVNQKIKEDLEVKKEEMSYKNAVATGALALVKEDKPSFPASFPLHENSAFKEKYPETVTVYFADDFSREICGGPHVKKTSELGNFKIIKEESCGAGVRRIRAILK